MSSSLVRGIGINDGKYPAWVNGKQPKVYSLWSNLLKRCYSPNVQGKQPTYLGCSVSENFKSYSYFHDWCQNQMGFGQEGFQLDKDLLLKGNKVYSEDTCVFLPNSLNLLLITHKVNRGSLPIGVSANRGRFRAQCFRNPAPKHIGYFDTPEEAFNAYKQAKEAFIKAQAEKWKALIDPRAYAALMAYEVSITD